MPYGYQGKILRVNLSDKTTRMEKPHPNFYREYMGGRNIALYYLLKELKAGIDPLGVENKLIFSTSMLTGSGIPGTSRYSVAAKSPLTGGYGESEAGGWWGPELKSAGYDALIIEGKANKPVYLWIKDGEIKIKDASQMWGKTTGEVEKAIKSEIGEERARILQIGPAGENLVRFANMVNELKHFNGRAGLGAVMGYKKLKAIAIRGTKRPKLKSPKEVGDFKIWFAKNLKKHEGLQLLHKYGTAKGVMSLNEMGLFPTSNFRKGSFEQAEKISGEKMAKTLLEGRDACRGCPVVCKRSLSSSDNFNIHPKFGGPEYETIGSLGSNCEIDDLEAIGKANELCSKYAMDTISTGVTIAWAMECFEKGIITKVDTDGLELTFGNGEALVKLVKMIALRKGIGDLLAEGSARAANKFGKGSSKYSMNVKGQELPAHEPRGKWGVGLGYAVSPTGADHLQSAHDTWFDHEGDSSKRFSYIDISDLHQFGILNPVPSESLSAEKVRLFTYLQFWWSLHNVLDICIFVSAPEYRMISLNQLVKLIEEITGWKTSIWEIMKQGEKGITLARCFNVREGFDRSKDILPERLFKPMKFMYGSKEGIDKQEFENALSTYYEMMGWDSENGIPTFGKLAELAITWVYEEIS